MAPAAGSPVADRSPGGAGLRAALSSLDGPLRFLLLSSFLIPLGSFMVLPFMSVFLHERLGMGLGTVGVVLAAASLVQFSGGVAGGALANRIGLRRTMLWALLVRTAGFAGFLLALRRPPLAVGALILTCCGAALYLPANKAYLVHGVADERRPAFLSAGNAALNAGMAVGPLVAGPFVLSSPGWLFTVVTALFVLVTAGHARLPAVGARGGSRAVRRRAGPARRGGGPAVRRERAGVLPLLPLPALPGGVRRRAGVRHLLQPECCCSASRWSSSSSRSPPA